MTRSRRSLLVAAVAAAVLVTGAAAAPADLLPGELVGAAPWPRNTDDLAQRLRLIGLRALGKEGTKLHFHVHLDVRVQETRVTVPGGIGIDPELRFFAPLHTHDATGVIHVESANVRRFTLGHFFDVWGVRLTPRCIGGYCARGAEQLRVFVNGKRVRTDPNAVRLTPHAEILVAFGTERQLPRPIPARYAFRRGL